MHTAHVPAGDGPFPTVVLLHGWGASAHDLFGLAPYLHGGNAVVLCPQGSLSFDVGGGFNGYGWFDLSRGLNVDPAEVARACVSVSTFIDDAVGRYPVDKRRLLLAGFSQGGFVAYQLALQNPARFAGLMALSSWLPADLAAHVPATSGHATLSTLVVHGTEDPMIQVERGRESRDALVKMGVPVVYHEFPMGHEISPDALRTVVRWIEERVFSPILRA